MNKRFSTPLKYQRITPDYSFSHLLLLWRQTWWHKQSGEEVISFNLVLWTTQDHTAITILCDLLLNSQEHVLLQSDGALCFRNSSLVYDILLWGTIWKLICDHSLYSCNLCFPILLRKIFEHLIIWELQ